MKIALFQLCAWEVESMTQARKAIPEEVGKLLGVLDLAAKVDLAVFPEHYPFAGRAVDLTIEEAKDLLEQVNSRVSFVAGGYVSEGEIRRNSIFLTKGRLSLDFYFKRVPWRKEGIVGERAKMWSLGRRRLFPMICSDVCEPWNKAKGQTAKMMAEALSLGVSKGCPIIVPTFGADLREPYWTEPLSAWAKALGTPIVVVAVAGVSEGSFKEFGEERRYGGGGSGVYWPDGTVWPPKAESVKRGVYLVDLTDPQSGRFIELPKRARFRSARSER
ncbi:hypothetical protein ACM9XB_03295 [Xanthomonas sacchari]